MFLVTRNSNKHVMDAFHIVYLIILQQLNEAIAVTVSCFRDEDMEPLDLTQVLLLSLRRNV